MAKERKQNCWEFKDCGREPGGQNAKSLGICPAATDQRADGIHGGKNGGRCCWVVAGTFCKGEVQGTFAKKWGTCQKCDFYNLVREDEYPKFRMSVSIFSQLRDEN